MKHRRIVRSFETDKVTVEQARNAALAVKAAREKSGSSGRLSPTEMASLVERYLGHFGSNSRKSSRAGKERDTSTTKASAKKGLRRAS